MLNLDLFQPKNHIWHININLIFFGSFLLFYCKGPIWRFIILNECMAGGRLYAHLKSKEIVYYFGTNVPFTLHSNSLLTLDQDSLDIYSFFMADETHSNLASIFNNKDTNQDNVNDY